MPAQVPAQAQDPVLEPALVVSPLPDGTVDVTAGYPDASNASMCVLQDKHGLWVYDNEGEEPANDKPLKKKEVVSFIKELLADHK